MATRTWTVLFTDLANYTAAIGRADREAVRHLVALHEKVVTPVITARGGRIVKNLGDSYMALFPAATDAVRAGVELVETIPLMTKHHIRAAMATGDVEEIVGDAFGEAVNLAARLIARTPESEVWLSPGTLHCMNQSEVAWEPVASLALKGIAGEVEVSRAVPSDRAFLPQVVADAARGNRLVRLQRGDPLPPLSPQVVLLLEGFTPGSPQLRDVVDRLPVVDPGSLWLSTYRIAPSDRLEWLKAGRGLVIGTPAAVDRAIRESVPTVRQQGTDTIIIDGDASVSVELISAGLALPAVPMSEVVAAYSYDLLPDLRWVHKSDAAIARVEVSQDAVSFHTLSPGILYNGRQLGAGATVTLHDRDSLLLGAGLITYRTLQGRIYLGVLLADAVSRLGVGPGQVAEIGRDPNFPGLSLPDRRGQENLRWCVGVRAARARENGFTLDRVLAGRRQCVVIPAVNGPTVLRNLHERCPTYVWTKGGLEQVVAERIIAPGDLIIVSTTAIAVREPAG